jgi:hypothetical protein
MDTDDDWLVVAAKQDDDEERRHDQVRDEDERASERAEERAADAILEAPIQAPIQAPIEYRHRWCSPKPYGVRHRRREATNWPFLYAGIVVLVGVLVGSRWVH